MAMLKYDFLFLKGALEDFKLSGSVWPTSKPAALALTQPLRGRKDATALKILELGPGTGAVTDYILEAMQPEDSLSICEISADFMRVLREKLTQSENFIRHRQRVKFYECPVQNLPETEKYDVIICALPFLNFDRNTISEILAKLARVSGPNAVMTYYQYMWLRSLGKKFSSKQRRRRLRDHDSIFKPLLRNHLAGKKRIWRNMLPVKVYTLNKLNSMKIAQ